MDYFSLQAINSRVFDRRDHLHQWIVKKDHFWIFLSKETTFGWWRQLGPKLAGTCRLPQRRHVSGWRRRLSLPQVGPTACPEPGMLAWHMPPAWKPTPCRVESPHWWRWFPR
jgi:hypothetical protein